MVILWIFFYIYDPLIRVMFNYVDPKEKTKSRNFKYDMFNIYVPRDEQFSRHKKSEFQDNKWKSLIQAVSPGIEAYLNFISRDEFNSFQEINSVYDDGTSNVLDPFTSGFFKAISCKGKFPLPQVIKGIIYIYC